MKLELNDSGSATLKTLPSPSVECDQTISNVATVAAPVECDQTINDAPLVARSECDETNGGVLFNFDETLALLTKDLNWERQQARRPFELEAHCYYFYFSILHSMYVILTQFNIDLVGRK